MRTALAQITASDDPAENCATLCALLAEAAAEGAGFVLTPETCNCISGSRAHQAQVLQPEASDPTLATLREAATRHGLWLLIGSLALKSDGGPDSRFHNRSFVIGPTGEILARYDKIHMFDVDIDATETYRESAAYAPGAQAVLARTPFATLGLSICYDLRFGALHRTLAQAGADVLTVPAAFSPVTGAAHWEVLLRARAIETGCWVLAPAQCGTHPARAAGAGGSGRARQTHGHSLAVAPWGEVVADGGSAPGLSLFTLDMAQVARARARVPALAHDRPFSPPT